MKIELKSAVILFFIVFIIAFFSGKMYERSKIPTVTEYACNDKKTVGVQYYKEKVHIGLSDDREYTLSQVTSASGARYVNDDETIVFWNQGDNVFLQEGALITYSNCMLQ